MRLLPAGLALLALTTSAAAQAPAARAKVDAEPKLAVAVLAPAPGQQARAVVRLTAVAEGLRVVADATGLPANARSNLLLRMLGDLSAPDGARVGGYYPDDGKSSPGAGPCDLGGFQADAKGAAHLEGVARGLTLGGVRGLLGRALTLHAQGPPGGPGPCLALGVVGLAADATPPVVTLLAPKEGARINRNPVNVVVTVTDDVGVASVTIGGVAAQPDPAGQAPGGGGRWKAAITARAGSNRVEVVATDVGGNSATGAVSFLFNDKPPEVKADATILVEGKVDDLTCVLTVNGQPVTYDKTTGAWTARVTADPSDPRKITVVATDEYGNARTELRQLR
jgi:Cu-Zn family superoxide dismutase